ncbi:type II toxin-antitoxin system HicA family toxin [Scytonema millei VB511283]|uniref:Type II toxin-antitoxin system HicA family toxin n=1 Tax=Scytonema millei VB511283 TaxID=1245923 RepID=A0A9X5I2E0_9CYAN|nr:type II toxin-antitoxin system HicA family toxin [Scytonema millei VB511283]
MNHYSLGKEAVKVFVKFDYVLDHQTGSHMILWHESRPTLSVPNHRELAPGLLRSLIRQAGMTVDEFLANR